MEEVHEIVIEEIVTYGGLELDSFEEVVRDDHDAAFQSGHPSTPITKQPSFRIFLVLR